VTARAVALCGLALLLAGCAPRLAQRARTTAPASGAIIGALARREAAMRGIRISMSVRLTGTEQGSMLSSPAYLAVDDAGGIRLQVLSPFGVTVLDLAIEGPRYTLVMPLRNTRSEGIVDLDTLAHPEASRADTAADRNGDDDKADASAGNNKADASGGDKMILALALLFRPKIDQGACDVARVVTCRMAGGVRAEVTLDDALRPAEERYLGPDGTPIVVARFTDYTEGGAQAFPGRIAIQDPATGTTLDAHIVRVRRAPPRTDG